MPKPKPAAVATPVTIRDVAALAGVSVAAVSRFVNAKQRFTPDVEARIAAAIAQVGYRSNPAARGMATGRSGAVAVLVAGVDRPQTAALVKGVSREALLAGYDLLIVDTAHAESPAREVQRVLSLQVDGLVMATALPAGSAELLVRYGRPFIDLTRAGAGRDMHLQAGALVARYLARSGHRRLLFLASDEEAGSAAQIQGLQQALVSSALSLHVHTVSAATASAAAACASALVLAAEPPDAVVACNDLLAMGLLSEVQRLGVAVPAALSVVGMGNMPLSAYLTPALTTVDLSGEAQGACAMRQLLAAMRGEAGAEPALAVPAPRLVVRDSSAAR
jgi:LacI family transcriptional regulator